MACLVAILFILLPAVVTQQVCNQTYPTPAKFERVFVASSKGPRPVAADSAMMKDNLGGCRSLDEHAEKMMEYFESWGVDMSSRRERAYEVIDDDDVTITPLVVHPDGLPLITVGSYFDFSTVINTPYAQARWRLVAKANMTGTRGVLPQGTSINYGMYRFEYDQEEVCIVFYSGAPSTRAPGRFEAALNFVVYHKDWNFGLLRGVLRFSKPNRELVDIDFVMTFPGDSF